MPKVDLAIAHVSSYLGLDEEPLTIAERDRLTDCYLNLAATQTPEERCDSLDVVILLNLPIAESIARRYSARGLELEDLVQVAHLALVKAANAYRPGAGQGFLGYAVPTIAGEIKRHFRDSGWFIRPPRRLQELYAQASAARAEMTQASNRAPTLLELAEYLDCEVRDLIEAQLAQGSYAAVSIDSSIQGTDHLALRDTLVADSDPMSEVEDRAVLDSALDKLSSRDRHILYLRFVLGYSQAQVGDEIGASQMQVSRLLRRILSELHDDIGADSVA
ncbi:MAG: sigma-70 family RNA polymerase sigma factor [Dermatophilus congolensis]|nr:sigma-70 family RNA polymerase sigma factor [Dermatophilus congolensis]